MVTKCERWRPHLTSGACESMDCRHNIRLSRSVDEVVGTELLAHLPLFRTDVYGDSLHSHNFRILEA